MGFHFLEHGNMKRSLAGNGKWVSRLFVQALLAAAIAAGPAAGAEAPSQRHITLIVASATGGPADSAARIIAGPMSAALGQQIIIENVPGGGGMIGAARVARAPADGHSLLLHQTGLTIAPSLNPKLGFDVAKDFVPVGLVNTSFTVLVGRKSIPANDFAGLIAWMRGPGRPVQFAHPGVGTLGHLTTVLFGKSVKTDINPVPYKGIGPAMADIIGDHVDLVWAGSISAAPLVQSGKVKAFAYAAETRNALLPNVPSVAEVGYPEMAIPFWHAMYAPAATPRPVLERLNEALRRALSDPQVVKAYKESGTEAFPTDQWTIEAATVFVRRELDRWARDVRENNIQVEQ
jgi:tripartite-type tricarboxylate transporter receptor subunit TctC